MRSARWPVGEGELARLVREHDWATTPLGPIDTWPRSLKTLVDLMLESDIMMSLMWGREAVQIYNDAYAVGIGARHPRALGGSTFETWADVRPVFEPLFERAWDGETVVQRDLHLHFALDDVPHQEAWFDLTYTRVLGERGEVAGVLAILTETTPRVLAERERAAAEAALRESEERFRGLVEGWAQAVWETNAQGVVVSDSPSWRAFTGQTLEEWLGFGWVNAIHPDDRAYAERQWREAVAARRNVNAEFRLRRAAGGWQWTNVRAVPLLAADGTVLKWVGMNINISERKRAEEALRASEERYRLAVEAADLGRWELVPETGEFYTSATCNRHLGLSPEAQPTHEGHFETIHPDDHEMIYRALRQAAEESGEFEVEYRTLHPGGAVRWIMSRARVVDDHDSASARFIGVTLDVTEHRKAEEERARLRALELTARAEAIERKRIGRELHDRVAHSMGVVHQSLELYGAYAKKDPALALEKLQLAKESTRRALDQTRNLSSELERSHVEDTQEGVVGAVRALLETHVPPGVEATLSVSGDELSVPPLVGEQVYLIMREAVRNAVAHSACGRIRVTLEVQDGELYGRVEDDGVGFDSDGKLAPGRFGEDSSHSGVGLRSMRGRAELLGGEVAVSSEPRRGTKVEVRLPLE